MFECDNILNGKGEWGANIVPRPQFENVERIFTINRNNNRASRASNPAIESNTRHQHQHLLHWG